MNGREREKRKMTPQKIDEWHDGLTRRIWRTDARLTEIQQKINKLDKTMQELRTKITIRRMKLKLGIYT